MKAKNVMVIAGEASGDALAAELVKALRQSGAESGLDSAQFFGAGGAKMEEAGLDLVIDMTQHAVIGLADALRNYTKFRRIFDQLLAIAVERKPDLIILVDFSGFNRRFANAVRCHIRQHKLKGWSPRIVQYVSPQVWASRPSRAEKMAKDVNLLLCIFPFEKAWYAERVPDLRVEFVGHPIFDRYPTDHLSADPAHDPAGNAPLVVLLPGSRTAELKRHLPVMLRAAEQIRNGAKVEIQMVLPNESLAQCATEMLSQTAASVTVQTGGLAAVLSRAAVAIASTGTVLMECAYFGVPTVAMYKTSWSTYQIGKRIVQVKYLSMPNILADKMVFPEFIQHDATADKISREALALLTNAQRRDAIQIKLRQVVQSLGGPGASQRAANAVVRLLGQA